MASGPIRRAPETVLRGLLTLILALVSLPLTILYFLIRLTCGGGGQKRINPNGAQARRIRAAQEARNAQMRADAIAAAHARRRVVR